MSNQDIDKLLASIDADLLNPIEDDVEDDGDVSDRSNDGLLDDDVDLNNDPELLKELNRIAAQAGEPTTKTPKVKKVEVEEEDPDLLRELYQLTSSTSNPPTSISNPNVNHQSESLNFETNIETQFSINSISDIEAQKLEKTILDRQFQLKKLALDYRKSGDLNTTKKLMVSSKSLDSALELVRNKFHPGSDFKLPPLLPQPPQSTTPTSQPVQKGESIKVTVKEASNLKSDSKQTATRNLQGRMDQLEILDSQLSLQMEEAGKLARQFFKSEDKPNALRFQRYKRAFQQQLEKVSMIKSDPNLSLPGTKQEVVKYQIPQVALNIPPNVLQLEIVEGYNLTHPSLGAKLADCYVNFDLNFDTFTQQPNKGYTNTVYNSADPKFNQAFELSLDMTSRAWLRHCQRKGLSLEVFHYRGFLYRAISLGKATLPLDQLVNSNMIELKVPILNPKTRKPTNGHLKIRVKTRNPIESNRVKDTVLDWITIVEEEKHNEEINKPVDNKVEIINNTSSISKKKVNLPTHPTKVDGINSGNITEPDDKLEQLLQRYFDLNNVSTKPAIEYELEIVKRNLPNPYNLPHPYLHLWQPQDRKISLEAKLQAMELLHQLEQLDIVKYFEDGNRDIKLDTELMTQLQTFKTLSNLVNLRQKRIEKVREELEVIKEHMGW